MYQFCQMSLCLIWLCDRFLFLVFVVVAVVVVVVADGIVVLFLFFFSIFFCYLVCLIPMLLVLVLDKENINMRLYVNKPVNVGYESANQTQDARKEESRTTRALQGIFSSTRTGYTVSSGYVCHVKRK